jgi:hypothetical protein
MFNIPLFIGTTGAVCILAAFLLVQSHRWSQDSLYYDILNFAGSVLLLMYGWIGEVWPFVVLNAVWALYSLKDIVADTRRQPKQIRKNG